MSDLECSNRLVIEGNLVELDDLRYTPAGIARIGMKIQHVSTRQEAGTSRRVTCEIPGLAFGDVALQASQMRQGQRVAIEGFIAQRSQHNRQLVLHINNIRSSEGA